MRDNNARETKRASIMVNMEPSLHEILTTLVVHENSSASAYVRKLIIKDMRERGILPDKILADLYAGA